MRPGNKGVRVRGGRGTEKDEGAVALLAELLDKYEIYGLPGEVLEEVNGVLEEGRVEGFE